MGRPLSLQEEASELEAIYETVTARDKSTVGGLPSA